MTIGDELTYFLQAIYIGLVLYVVFSIMTWTYSKVYDTVVFFIKLGFAIVLAYFVIFFLNRKWGFPGQFIADFPFYVFDRYVATTAIEIWERFVDNIFFAIRGNRASRVSY